MLKAESPQTERQSNYVGVGLGSYSLWYLQALGIWGALPHNDSPQCLDSWALAIRILVSNATSLPGVPSCMPSIVGICVRHRVTPRIFVNGDVVGVPHSEVSRRRIHGAAHWYASGVT